MTANLPALPMCEVCPDPGKCCRLMTLSQGETSPLSLWRSEGTALHALVVLARHGLPMLPARQDGPFIAVAPDAGREYVHWLVSCPELLPGGRCGIYEDRPRTCRDFAPGSGPLCVYHVGEAPQ